MVSVTTAVCGAATKFNQAVNVGAIHGFHDAAHNLERIARIGALHNGEQSILGGEDLGSVRAATREGGNAPLPRVAGVLRVPGLMRTVKGAQAQVNNAHGSFGGVAQRRG